jgi:AraC family transcriptional regulator
MRRVIEHVYDHLDQPLDLNALADVAHLSPHHWHRVYHAMCGETLAQAVKRLRLHRAAGELANGATPIARVGERAGYPNLQSFTRMFKAEYGLPPAAFRSQGQHRDFAWQREERPGMRMLAHFCDDPDLVAEPELRSFAAVAGCADAPADVGLLRLNFPGGRYAVVLHTGPYSTMRATYRWLYGHWLPRSGHEPAGVGVHEEYLNSPRDTAPQALRTRIALALSPT